MQLSKLCSVTSKDIPADAKIKSHILMLRAGYMKQVSGGIYSLSPLAQKACLKIENIIREEMNKLGGQEVKFPVVMPKEMWDASGRYESIGNEMVRFEDRNKHKMLLGMTHEEASVHLAKNWITSYTQLPFMIYQIQTKFRDEPRSRAGLIRVREFVMKDAYSFHQTTESLDEFYYKMLDGYNNIFRRIGLKNFISVKSDSGMMGGSIAHEFMSINESGEDEIAMCDCGYRANIEVAECVYGNSSAKPTMKPHEVFTGSAKDIESVCKLLQVESSQTVKAVAFAVRGSDELVLVFIRGDKEVNEAKLKKFTKKDIVAFSAENDSRLCAGNIGPLGEFDKSVTVVFDQSLKGCADMVCGANKKDYHIQGLCITRDLPNIEFAEVAKVKAGDACPLCSKPIQMVHGIEIGNIFQLGTKYTASMDMRVHADDGSEFNPIMGCYGIGVGRALACVVEDNSDENGIIMPKSIAPYPVHICPLRLDDENVAKVSSEILTDLESAGIECLFDDRNLSAGAKFADSDLIGMPIRVVISPKGLAGGTIEIKDRTTNTVYNKNIKEAVQFIKDLLNAKE